MRMRKSVAVMGLAGASMALASSAVFAQSSVTLYGSMDMGVDYVTNSAGHHLEQASSGKRTPDRFGFRITEDIGGGTTVFANLEAGFSTNTGASINPTSFFNRTALVGVSNDRFGSISLGHMPDFMYVDIGPINDSVPGISSFYTQGNLDGLANTHANDNTVKYLTPEFYGFQAGAMNSFGTTPGNFSSGRQYSFGGTYAGGPLKAAVAYSMSHNRTADVLGTFGVTSLLGQNLSTGSLFNASRYRTYGAAASLALGAFVPHLTMTDVSLGNSLGSVHERNYQAGVNIDLSGGKRIYILGISYSRSTFEELAFNQYNLFLTDYLSKSTQVYVGGGLQRASGPNARADQFGYVPSSSNSQTVARIGINHMF
jgi:predicted porin